MIDADGRPLHVTWAYDRAEVIADGIVHAVGIAFALAGGTALVVLAALWADGAQVVGVAVYALGLLALMSVSAAYNLWPVSRTKWLLRRADHALIFVLIAATYTPFVSRFPSGWVAQALLAGVWIVAFVGAGLKIALPGRLDRLSIVLCVVLGGSGALVYETVAASLPASTVALMIAGGITYVAGIAFHLWHGLRFQNAVWHGFVLVASVLFYSAVLDGVVLA